jgi:mannosyltransferase
MVTYSSSKSRITYIVPFGYYVLLILLAGFALRLYRLGADSLWYDETVSAYLAAQPVVDLVGHTARDIHPPGYYLLLHFWAAAAGQSEFALAFFSLIFGVLLIALTYRLARLLTTPNTAMWAALLVAVSPYHLWYSQEVRMYTLGAALGIAATYCALRAITSPDNFRNLWGLSHRFWLGYILCAALGLYTLYYFAFLLVILNLVFIACLLKTTKINLRQHLPLPQAQGSAALYSQPTFWL